MKFTPPTIEEVLLQCGKIGLPESEGKKYWYYYDSCSWTVGRKTMSRWKSALSGWKIRYDERTNFRHQQTTTPNPRNSGITITITGPTPEQQYKLKLQRQDEERRRELQAKLDQQKTQPGSSSS